MAPGVVAGARIHEAAGGDVRRVGLDLVDRAALWSPPGRLRP